MTEQNALRLGPGLHAEIPEESYRGMPEASQSALWELMLRSPAHGLEAQKLDSRSTPSKRLGTAVHCAVLQPDLFRERYVVAGQCCATKRDGNQCSNTGAKRFGGEWYCNVKGHAPDGEPDVLEAVLEPDGWNKCMAIRDVAAKNKDVQALLSQGSRRELTAIWIDDESGVGCKARLDLPSDDGVVITDLKTTTNASFWAFSDSIYRYGYYFQGAHYTRGGFANGMPAEIYCIIALENEAPFGIQVYEVEGEALDAGLKEVRTALAEWAACEFENDWPTYPPGAKRISLPPHSWKQIDRRIAAFEHEEVA